MPPWIAPVLWFCVLVLAPGLGSEVQLRTLWRYRLNPPSGERMGRGLRGWADLDARNYAGPGQRALRILKLLMVLQMVGLVVWGAVFIL